MDIDIRVASPDDVEAIETLTKKLVELVKDSFIPKRFEWGIQRRLYDPLQKHGILVAVDRDAGSKVVGVIFAELRVDPYGLSEGYIKNFIVDVDYRGQGIGKLLLEKSIEHLKTIKVEKILVNLNENEPAAQKAASLYDSFGFKKKYTVLQLDLTND